MSNKSSNFAPDLVCLCQIGEASKCFATYNIYNNN